MSRNILRRFVSKWKSYRYRFVPWIALNLKDRSIRAVPTGSSDKIITDQTVEETLLKLFAALNKIPQNGTGLNSATSLDVMMKVMGFKVERATSQVGGTGVYVTDGMVPKGTVLAMYPGAIYFPYEPILLQSISNPFIFRCIDGILIDGNDKRLSKVVYRSCSKRDRLGPYMTCDVSWLTSHLDNPIALGQYVNNHSKKFGANVAYQEYNVTEDFPLHLMKYIPNVRYSPPSIHEGSESRVIRTVVLVSTRDIKAGEEVFSTYFTMVY
ncbi:SET domain-containing protein 9-like [Ptychodera flava]|uniref:SET domain-containing protein 9-like n=1 Tax=Ptychodera flava TaxID=63121 RepID=UPI00396A0B4F